MSGSQPQRLTDFTFVDMTVAEMGAGGFGLVYMGPDRLHDDLWLALKTLRPELLALRPQVRDLFLSECLIWVGFWPHANLLTAQSATLMDGRIYLVLDYAQHGSLRDLLALNQPLRVRLRWAQHVAAGLLALHTPDPEFLRPQPLVHRDLKPENVLVDASGYAKITDFGLAAAIGGALAQTSDAPNALADFALVAQLATQQTSMRRYRATRITHFTTRSTRDPALGLGGVGTIAYMPPEQWDTNGNVGAPADLYAFGLILSELLAGRHGLADLEAELDDEGWYQLHLNGTPRPLRSGPAEGASRLPAEVEQLYYALLAKRPEDRPTAGEALAVLRQAATHVGEEPYIPPDIWPRTDEHRMMQWHNWANTFARFDLSKEALTCNERALAIDPNNVIVLNSRSNIVASAGRKAEERGQTDQGKRLLEEALRWNERTLGAATTDGERTLAQSMRALRLAELRRYAEAEDAYATVLALDPNNGSAWRNRTLDSVRWARAEAQAGQRSEAVRLYRLADGYIRQALRLSPNDARNIELRDIIQHERAQLES
ncbi:MAG TPA: protein kinase [Ktedonobacterales bacterium]|nr:protein kinase [Ktedonobacterales bacterium]